MESKKSNFKQNPDNLYDTEMRLKAVEGGGGVASHNAKMADEERLGVPSYDESVVSDYIRNRTEAPKDMTDGRGVLKVETVEQVEGEYEKDLKKLQALTRKQLDELLTSVEKQSKEGRGLFSKGNLLNGYAIDAETLESIQTTSHDSAGFDLAVEISQKMRDRGASYEEADMDKIARRVIKGFVYLKVPDFQTPIVRLWLGMKEMGDLVPQEDLQKITSYLKRERKLLPISSDFRVL